MGNDDEEKRKMDERVRGTRCLKKCACLYNAMRLLL